MDGCRCERYFHWLSHEWFVRCERWTSFDRLGWLCLTVDLCNVHVWSNQKRDTRSKRKAHRRKTNRNFIILANGNASNVVPTLKFFIQRGTHQTTTNVRWCIEITFTGFATGWRDEAIDFHSMPKWSKKIQLRAVEGVRENVDLRKKIETTNKQQLVKTFCDSSFVVDSLKCRKLFFSSFEFSANNGISQRNRSEAEHHRSKLEGFSNALLH